MSVWKYLGYDKLNYEFFRMSVVIGDYWMFSWLSCGKRSWGAVVGVLVSLFEGFWCEQRVIGVWKLPSRSFEVESLRIWLKFGFCCYVGVWFWCGLWFWWLVFYLILMWTQLVDVFIEGLMYEKYEFSLCSAYIWRHLYVVLVLSTSFHHVLGHCY